MPYLKSRETDTLTLPSDPSYHVEMKKRPTYGDKLYMQKAMMRMQPVDLASVDPRDAPYVESTEDDSGKGMMTKIELDGYMKALLERLIVSWNLDGANGEIMPITGDTIELLESEDGDFLIAEAQRRLRPRAVVIERPFDGRSGQQSRATQLRIAKPSKH